MARLAPRSSLQLICDRDFGIVFWGKLIALTGVWAQTIAVVILTYQVTGSAAVVGTVGAAQLAPQLGLALVSGRLSDLHGPVSQILAGALLSGAGCLGLAVWLHVAHGRNGSTTIALLLASFVCGTGLALLAPALQAIVPMLVRIEELPAAVALNFVPTALARTLGPAGGAVLMSSFSAVAALSVIGMSLLLVTGAFLLVRRSHVRRPEAGGDSRISHALQYVWRDRALFALLGAVAAVGAASEPAITLAPVLAHTLGGGSTSGGWVTSSFGLGGLLGVLAHRYARRVLSPVREGCVALGGLGFTMALAGLGGCFPVVSVALVLGGANMMVAITAFSIAIQQRCPVAMMGRIMALWIIAFSGVRPVAGPVLGFVADHLSTATAFCAAAVFAIAAAAAVRFVAEPIGRPAVTAGHSSSSREASPRPEIAA